MRLIRTWFSVLLLCVPLGQAWAWGQEGHAIVAEIAQRRLSPTAAAAIDGLLGRGHTLASEASWADGIREARPSTYNWHFVNIPRGARYEAARDCPESPRGDCVVAELERLKSELYCADNEDKKRDALRYAIHFIGDIHQPLHTVSEERGGNGLMVRVEWRGLACTGRCVARKVDTNFHAAWDSNLITTTVWDWGAYVSRLEEGLLKDGALQRADGGSPADWANSSHALGQQVWDRVPASRVLDDTYYQEVLPIVDRQLALGGLRLARFLNEAYSAGSCPLRQEQAVRRERVAPAFRE